MAVLEDRLRALFVGRGFLEARSAAFAPETEGDVELALPLSSAECRLRRALVPGLLRRVESNFNRGRRDIRLFEIGTVFGPAGDDGIPTEATHVSAVFTGKRRPPHWTAEAEAYDIWDASGLMDEVAAVLGLRVRPASDVVSRTFAAAEAFAAVDETGTRSGEGGRVADAQVDAPAWAEPVWAIEIRLDTSMAGAPSLRFRALPTQPAIERDLSLVGAASIPAAELGATIADAAGDLLERVEPFDVYEGAGIGAHERSMAFRLTFRAPDRTLTDTEIDAVVKTILHRLEQEHDVRQRG
jgi:phenylalanyl-tRNA synthetase beta chain